MANHYPPSPEDIRRFTAALGPMFAQARAADEALAALRQHGASYLTRSEVRLVEQYGRATQRAQVAGQPGSREGAR